MISLIEIHSDVMRKNIKVTIGATRNFSGEEQNEHMTGNSVSIRLLRGRQLANRVTFTTQKSQVYVFCALYAPVAINILMFCPFVSYI